jgi:hypothetical protein
VRIAARLRDLRPTADWIHREQIDELTKSLSSPRIKGDQLVVGSKQKQPMLGWAQP